MNLKRIYCIMKKYSLFTKVRKSNPYKKMAKATHEHKICKNILNREFKQEVPQKVLLTNITYLYYGKGQRAFLSCVKDCATREIVAAHVSYSLTMDLVYSTEYIHYRPPWTLKKMTPVEYRSQLLCA